MLVLLSLFTTLAAVTAVWIYARTRGVRVVHCPADGDVAAVHLAPAPGSLGLRVRDCSRWPSRKGCAQGCRSEIEESSDGCAFRSILTDWFAHKDCAYCGRPIAPPTVGSPRPGLSSPNGRIALWTEIPPASVFAMIATHRPVCANCTVVEAFRQRFPDRVIERPPHPRPGVSPPNAA